MADRFIGRGSQAGRRVRALMLAGALLGLGACGSGEAPAWRGTDITGMRLAGDWQLEDHEGKPRRLEDFRGKAVAVFFGYTQCPDVCPTTLATMAQAKQLLGAQAARFQVVFVTIDPERDTPALLAAYLPAFDPGFVGLYGDAENTARAAKDFKVFYQKQAGATPGSYTMDHSAGTYVLDTQGRLRLYLRHGATAADIAADVAALLNEKGA